MRVCDTYLGRKPDGALRPHDIISLDEFALRIGVGRPLFEYILADDIVRPSWDVDSYVPSGVDINEHIRFVRSLAEDSIRRQLDRWLHQIPLKEGKLDLAVASRHGVADGRHKVSFRFYLGGCSVRWGDMAHIIARCNPKEGCYSKNGTHIPMFDDIYTAERLLGIVMCPKTLQDKRILILETDHTPEAFLAQHVHLDWPRLELPVDPPPHIVAAESEDGRLTAPTETTVHAAPLGISRETAGRLLQLIKNDTLAQYQNWLKIGMACHANITEDLWEAFDERCRSAPGYDYRKNRQIWDAFHPDRSVTVRTLFWYAKQDSPDGFREVMHDLRIFNINSVEEAFRVYGATETALAASSAALFPRFRFAGKQWYEFKAPLWVPVCDGTIRKHLIDEVQPAWVRAAGVVSANAAAAEPDTRKRAMETATAMLKIAQTLFTHAGQMKAEAVLRVFVIDSQLLLRLDADPTLLAFNDKVWDWKLNEGRGGLRPGRPEDYLSYSTGYDWPEAFTDEELLFFRRFLGTIYPHDDVHKYMISMIWRCLDGRNPQREHNIFLLTGNGGNGKSLWLTIVQHMLGKYCYKAPIAMFCQKRASHTAADDHSFCLWGRRFVFASEPDKDFKDRLNGSLVKELTGGETMSARTLYGRNVHFTPQFFLALMFNDNLDLNGRDGGIARRVKVVRHVSRFRADIQEARPDMNLYPMDNDACDVAKRLAPKLLRMLLEAPREEFDLQVPARVRQWTEDYLGEHNVVQCFVRDRLVAGNAQTDFVSLSSLRDQIKWWATENGMEQAMKSLKLQDIKNDLEKELGDCISQKMIKNKNYRNVFLGWKILHNNAEQNSEDDDN